MKKIVHAIIPPFLLLLVIIVDVHAQLALPSIFQDGMVLQQESEITIWGWGKPVQDVTVTCSWEKEIKKTVVNNEGNWQVKFNTPSAGGPYLIRVSGNEEYVINDVLIGEVWLCSGQSNMEWSANAGILNANEAIENALYPSVRFFTVEHSASDYPQLDVRGNWETCTPEVMRNFSAIGYFYARELHKKLNVPIGIINASWGGTPAEIWTPKDLIENNSLLAEAAKTFQDNKWGPFKPGRAFNTMIHPLTAYHIAGVLWYQGESNNINAYAYETLFKTMITSWREAWGIKFPFYFAQIAPFNYGKFNGVEVREAQRRTLELPNTHMVVTSDIGDTTDIHPQDKLSVGQRFADIAITKHYQVENKVVSGPLYRSIEVNKNKVTIHFHHAKGLNTKEKVLTQFEVSGVDGKFYAAKAIIKEETVQVSSKKVKNPTAVRYGWKNKLVANLFNNAGLPASSFNSLEKFTLK